MARAILAVRNLQFAARLSTEDRLFLVDVSAFAFASPAFISSFVEVFWRPFQFLWEHFHLLCRLFSIPAYYVVDRICASERVPLS